MNFDGILQDARFALRALRRSPGFTITAVAMLAVGIGINAAVFTVTNTVLFRGFPHVDPGNRMLYIGSTKNGRGDGVSYPDLLDWAQAKSFQGMAAVDNGGLRLILTDPNAPNETCDGTRLTANSFQVLGQRPVLGRDFTSADEAPGAPPVAILNYAFWERRYSKDPSIIGRAIHLNGIPTTVLGVMPDGFDFPHHRVDLWVPLVRTANSDKREARTLWFAFGLRAPGVTVTAARTEMETIGRRLEIAYPLTNQGVRPRLTDFRDFFGPHAATFYGALWGAVGFVLLIACANLANLLLARAVGRFREISVGIALGASRWRVIRQLLIESLTLSILGGACGWLIAVGGVRAYEQFSNPPAGYDRWTFSMDDRIFVYLVAISIATGLLFGLAPALRLSRLDVNASLKDGARGATGGGRRLAAFLVIVEMALAIVLLAGAGVMLRSVVKMYTADIGVETGRLLTASVYLPPARYPAAPAQLAYFDRLTARLQLIPGVDSIALSDALPGLYAPRLPYEISGEPPVDEQRRPRLATVVITPNYFRTTGAAVIAGREFTDFDNASAPPVLIVNQRFASEHWSNENPLGKRLRVFDSAAPDAWRTVVGVASNIVQNDQTMQNFDAAVYIPFRQKPKPEMTILAQTHITPASLVSVFRRQIQAIDPELVVGSGLGSVAGPRTLDRNIEFNYWTKGVNAALFLIFAAVALLLASFGLYAVLAHSVGERTREIGVRMAVGATARDILRLVFTQGMLPLAAGLAIGLAASLAVNRVIESQLVRVSPGDPFTLIASSLVLIIAAALGCLIPARRAMRVDPVIALRHE